MASLATIRTEVEQALGNRSNITNRVDTWINDAYFEILMSPRFSFFELDRKVTTATVASQREYDVPVDMWFVLDIRDDTNNRKLVRGHWSEFDKRQAVLGIPSRYTRFQDKFEYDPTPLGAYTIITRYRIRTPELSDMQAPIFGREWDEPLTTLSIVKGFERLELPEEAAKFRTLIEQQFQVRQDAMELEDADAETTIGVRRE
jgi:hypothetical protein